MRRQMVYPGAIPLETDLLNTNKETMMALGFFAQAVLGTTTCCDGLACTPTTVPSLSVNVAPGSIYQFGAVDATSYSSLSADTTHSIMKQGILYSTSTVTLTPPGTVGYSINYLIEGQFQETDEGSTVLPYYNASNPAVAWSGPANAGTAQYTQRTGYVVLNVKAGTAAATGTQAAPTVDSGYVPLWVVTVAYGATAINTPNIVVHPSAPFINPKLFNINTVMSGLTHYGIDTSGTANLITVPISAPVVTSLGQGLTMYIKVANQVTGATTINVSGLGAVPLVRADGSVIQSSDIKAGQVIACVMDATPQFYLQSAAAAGATGSYLSTTGGTVTGPIVLPSNPSTSLQAATKQYVDSAIAGALPLSGGSVTGPIVLPSNPSANLQAATKQYVDSAVAGTVAPGVVVSEQYITASGSYTPTYGVTKFLAIIVGGGGSGGGGEANTAGAAASGGGGAGGSAVKLYTVASGSATCTIGAGGSSVTHTVNGNLGGTTSFSYGGISISASGGAGGLAASAGGTGGLGGAGSGGDLNLTGNPGGGGGAPGFPAQSGNGGASLFGSGGRGGFITSSTTATGGAYGGGGGGANGGTGAYDNSGAGGNGFIRITEFK